MGVSHSSICMGIICVWCVEVWVCRVIYEGRGIELTCYMVCFYSLCFDVHVTGGVVVACGTRVACHRVCGVIRVTWCEM